MVSRTASRRCTVKAQGGNCRSRAAVDRRSLAPKQKQSLADGDRSGTFTARVKAQTWAVGNTTGGSRIGLYSTSACQSRTQTLENAPKTLDTAVCLKILSLSDL